MTVLSINAEVAVLRAEQRRAEQKNEQCGWGPQPALKALADAAVTAAEADHVNSTTILGDAAAQLGAFADADQTLLANLRGKGTVLPPVPVSAPPVDFDPLAPTALR